MNRQMILGAVTLLFGITATAEALPVTLRLSGSDIPAVSCADGSPCDSAVLPGVVSFTTSNGTITVQLGGAGSASPALGPLDMDLSYFLTANAGAPGGTYVIEASVNDRAGSASWTANLDGNQTAGATTAFATFADAGNALFGQGSPLCDGGPTGATAVHLSCTSGVFSDPSFSLTESVSIATAAGVSAVSGNALMTAVASPPEIPEPTTMLLFGSAIGGAWVVRRMRARRGHGA